MTLLVLASGSPRRRDLLAASGFAFDVRPADVDESPLPGEGAEELVHRLAVAKAEAGLAAAPERPVVVLAADTLVSVDGEVLGKPLDPADAARMLRLLSGSRHQVLTGVAVATSTATAATLSVEVETTHVHMAAWTEDQIAAYVASGEPMDKAGSYAIQEVGDRFVTRIEGSFDNVVGLPVERTRRMLAEAGIARPEGQPPEV
ncbi:Maf family protein [Aquihabitans daechungensis]|uniref:Maf family protein n=1 Tax=Aquihabitans daechungensis TaxID=1052257 RepID=UPI003B9F7EEC